jgi:4-amino-4-deoxy-L-arabinose transferase-like glycosyltransferase
LFSAYREFNVVKICVTVNMNYFHCSKYKKHYLILLVVWLMALVIDRTWSLLDNSIPPHDQSADLKRALSHYRIFKNFNLFSGGWWLSLWELAPSYRPPFVYIYPAPLLFLFGQGY